MKHLLMAVLLLMIMTANINAQKTMIRGTVLSHTASAPIVEATVQFTRNDTVLLTSGVDAQGSFAVSLGECDSIAVLIKALDYNPITLIVPANKGDIDLDRIFMFDKSVQLDEVVVNGTGIVEKIDKSIAYPSTAMLKRSRGVYDMLAELNLPGIQVDALNKTASINGLSVVYKVNGVPKSRNEILAINPNNILRIEYVNRPSIRYINEGAGGVINFILKPLSSGGRFYEDISGSHVGSLNNTTQIAVNHKKSEFAINYALDWRKYNEMINNNNEKFIASGFSAERTTDDRGSSMRYTTNDISAIYTYQHDPKTMLTARLTYHIMPHHSATRADVTTTENGGAKEKYDLEQNVSLKEKYTTLDAFFKKELNKGGNIELNMVGFYSNVNQNREMIHTYESDEKKSYHTGVDNDYKSLIAEFAFEKPVKSVTYRLGIKDSYSHTNNQYANSDDNVSKMTRNKTYAYGELSGFIKKMGYSIGTGVYVLSLGGQERNKTYINNNTTLNLSYSYKQRIFVSNYLIYYPTDPGLSQLDDVSQTVDQYTAIVGNPDLKSYGSIYDRISFTFAHKNLYVSLKPSYWHRFNPITGIVRYNQDDKIFETVAINSKYSSTVGLNGIFNISNLWNHFTFGVNADFSHYVEDNGSDFHHSLNGMSLTLNGTYYVGKWKLGVSYHPLKEKRLSGETVVTTHPNYYISLQYQLKNVSFYMGGTFIFEKQGYQYDNESLSSVHPYTSYSTIRDNANWIVFGFNYRVNFGRLFNSGKKTLNNNARTNSAITVE